VLSFDPSQSSGNCQGCTGLTWLNNGTAPGNWPAIWMAPQEFLNGGSGTTGHVIDTSILEAWPGASTTVCASQCQPLVGTHDEIKENTSAPPQYAPDISSLLPGGFDFKQPHHYQFLWLPMAKNGGTGLMRWYVDGSQVAQITYNSAGLSTPDLSPLGGNGELSYADSQHFCLFIDPGLNANQSVHIGTVQVWQ
jgi:hypothetical protein